MPISFFSKISIPDLRAMIHKRNAKKLSKLNRILLWINYIFIISLLSSVASKYISPNHFGYLPFLD